MLKHPGLQLSSVVLLSIMLAFLGPGRAFAQDATVKIVQQAATRAGLNGVPAPAVRRLVGSAEATSTTDTHLTTSIVVDVLLLMAAVVFLLGAIVFTIWPPTYGRTKLLTVSRSEPKPHSHDRPRVSGAGNA
jgi:hypothetical protein